MIDNVEWFGQSALKIKSDKIIYFDPYNIKNSFNDADLIFITHDHYDHFSKDDIKKCMKSDTIFVVPYFLMNSLIELGIKKENIMSVKPNSSYNILNYFVKTILAYNENKPYHKMSDNYVSYVIKVNNIIYYIVCDSDCIILNTKVKCDILFVPVGGTFTMDYKEAAMFANLVHPKVAIPIHYGSIVGQKSDGANFVKELDKSIVGKTLEVFH